MNAHSDEKIVEAWEKNASQWAVAVRDGRIESRSLVTNKAIVDAVLSRSPASVLDLGCGEGWLVRELAGRVERAVGADVAASLVEKARAAGSGEFLVESYEAIAGGAIEGSFDAVVCNFSLLGKGSVDGLFRAVPSLLNRGGMLVVQTLHPVVACGDLPYRDGWRDGSWDGLDVGLVEPAPWYFRTLESWVALFLGSGFRLLEMREPIHPATHRPVSVIFVALVYDKNR